MKLIKFEHNKKFNGILLVTFLECEHCNYVVNKGLGLMTDSYFNCIKHLRCRGCGKSTVPAPKNWYKKRDDLL